MLRMLLIEEEEEEDEDTYIYYGPEDDIDELPLSSSDLKEDDEDSCPIYDTDGDEEFIEEMEEGNNFVVGNEIVQAIAEEINFVDVDKIDNEMVTFVE